MEMTIYVPRAGSPSEGAVAAGSAIVGDASPDRLDGFVECDFEGAVHGQSNIVRYLDRILVAAGRRRELYPTVARRAFPSADMVAVGTYDACRHVVTSLWEGKSLTAWCGEEPEAILGRRLDPGSVPWADAAAAIRPGGRQLGGNAKSGTTFWFQTTAGQVARLNARDSSAEIFEHDDPGLPSMMEAGGVDAAVGFVTGR